VNKKRNHIERQIRIQSRTEVLVDVREFVSSAAREFGFSEDDVMKIEIAVDEACTNIIKHAYRNLPHGLINIRIYGAPESGKDRFEINITDTGESFDSSTYTIPNMPEYFKQLRRGGLGVFLMKKIMDEVDYGSLNTQENRIRLVKYLTDAA
jgi:serine/threonine-protein kinase RsbW